MPRLTPELLAAATGCSPRRAQLYAGPLAAACGDYGIDTPARLAAFLAQIGHESGSLRYVSEIWGPTAAQTRYEGRADLGNTEPGDGVRYRGRGLIQTTGRANYRAVAQRLRARFGAAVPDFEAEPDALTLAQWAALSAADYWGIRALNALADRGDITGIGRAINRGNAAATLPANGEADRLRRWHQARAAIAAAAGDHGRRTQDTAPPGAPPTAAPAAPSEDRTMSPFLAAALPAIVGAIPQLGRLFGSGSEVAQRNTAAAELAVGIVQQAVGARNAQEAAEVVATDPEQATEAARAVRARWGDILDMAEAGGGGIAGARQADAAAAAAAGSWWGIARSPSFVVAILLLPLVYLIVLSIIGLIGATEWSPDVRAAIAGTIVGSIVGGLVGYYYGQTTSRNRSGGAAP